ncbi:RepB family plasmid replication initiator protein [Candidatus Arsenophonus triatominarum]|uniref:RepB family plasmid replication initiator protein n=1 Tax=Candidatus Arsenophonus triatominarum TaxID=57911 RepID=UPI003CCBFFC2
MSGINFLYIKSQITFHVINGKKESFTVLNWLSGYKYQKIEGKGTGLKLRLNPDLDPFLFNIKHNFSWCFLNAITSVKMLFFSEYICIF